MKRKKKVFNSSKFKKCVDLICEGELQRTGLADEFAINYKTFERIYQGTKAPNTEQAWQFIRKFKILMSDMFGKPSDQNCDWSLIQSIYYPKSLE